MNPIDVVEDVRQSQGTTEQNASKQNRASNIVGPPAESRIVFLTRKVQISAFRLAETGTGGLLGARVKNFEMVPIEIDRVRVCFEINKLEK